MVLEVRVVVAFGEVALDWRGRRETSGVPRIFYILNWVGAMGRYTCETVLS